MTDLSDMSPELKELVRGFLGIRDSSPSPPGQNSFSNEPKTPTSGQPPEQPHIYRQRIYHLIPYGHFEEVLQLCERLNAIARARGGTGGTLWIPTVGAQNELIVEFEFPDLATFERGRAARN